LKKKLASRRAVMPTSGRPTGRRVRPAAPRRRRKIRVGVIYGGRSVEHEVSLVSARAIMKVLDPERYEVVPIGISRAGRWALGGTHYALPGDPSVGGLIEIGRGGRPGKPALAGERGRVAQTVRESRLDVVFPVVHGTGGEDGSLQGLLTLADIPFVGSGVLGSAVGMDKVIMKALFRHAGLPIVEYRALRARDIEGDPSATAASIEEGIGYPCFIKPANGGSSVGISKAIDRASLVAGLRLAARYDRKVVVERGVDAREIECSVLGNDRPEASVPGEIIPVNEFYDYRAKYIDAGSRIEIPAAISDEQREKVRNLAVRAFKVLDLAGMARVDFFVCRASGEVFLNEVNTIPGFTSISMYAKLWDASGIPFSELVDRLIELAFESHAERKALITTYDGRRNGNPRRP